MVSIRYIDFLVFKVTLGALFGSLRPKTLASTPFVELKGWTGSPLDEASARLCCYIATFFLFACILVRIDAAAHPGAVKFRKIARPFCCCKTRPTTTLVLSVALSVVSIVVRLYMVLTLNVANTFVEFHIDWGIASSSTKVKGCGKPKEQ